MIRLLSAWLGRLSVSRKLTLIYLLDLTAVFFVSGILFHEKYIAIDFARKELVGSAYTNAVRAALMAATLREPGAPVTDVLPLLAPLQVQRQAHDADLHAQSDAQDFEQTWADFMRQTEPTELQRVAVIGRARTLLTTVGNQSNLILDPDLDSYYVMSLVSLRFPELLEVMNDASRVVQDKRVANVRQSAGLNTQLLI
jgi:hypothetical protein